MLGLFFQLAPVAGTPSGSDSSRGLMSFLPMILIIVFMYLLVFLPESKRRKKLQKQIDSLKQGDKIVTVGHVVGTVDFIGEKTVYIKSLDSKLEVAKSGIASVLNDGKIQ
ncbi:preprotein translocase subunit YajC [Brevinema andersonii]|uniref:Sec translocon accessory complex subunit YajC n=1 Tax=Brevinema andersonii TaxID=34097 RepID=A0A1I1CY94_BREAD|nr:preprotein translocase subunit YajC [Brevinema andersonii]SFB67494.1 preprotein translocase subunit YajC [Brevinema andersonii]